MLFQWVGFNFSRAISISTSNIFTAVRARTSTSRGFFVFSGSCSEETSMWYHMIHTYRSFCRFLAYSTQRPIAGAAVLIQK